MNSPHLGRFRALSVEAQTTTATGPPPGVSYLQPPYAAVHHDTGLRIVKLQTEDPEKVRSHVSKYKQVVFHAIMSFRAAYTALLPQPELYITD